MNGSGIGWNVGPFLLGPQKKRWRLRAARIPGYAGEVNTVRLGHLAAFDAGYDFVVTAMA